MSNECIAQKVEDTFFHLLSDKNFDEITVSEIVERVGCSRSSFYRNYTDKYGIVKHYLENVIQDFLEQLTDFGNSGNNEMILLENLLIEKERIQLLYSQKACSETLKTINELMMAYGKEHGKSVNQILQMAALTGAVFNVLAIGFIDKSEDKERVLKCLKKLIEHRGVQVI